MENKKLSSVIFERMNGAGNTFFLLNQKDSEKVLLDQRAKIAKKLCQGFRGFHTDGLLFLDKHPDLDFQWDFYNSDGSKAEMCGNAARCASLFYSQQNQDKKDIRFLTTAGIISAKILDQNRVRVQMTEVKWLKENLNLRFQNQDIQGSFLNTGVPHFVINGKPNRDIAVFLRRHESFLPTGSNITFFELIDSDKIDCVTFERGVENFTDACGTGAVAAAMVVMKKNKQSRIQVNMPGGSILVEGEKTPFMEGPAQFDFKISLQGEI